MDQLNELLQRYESAKQAKVAEAAEKLREAYKAKYVVNFDE